VSTPGGSSTLPERRRRWKLWRWLGLGLALMVVVLLWQLRAWLVTGNVHTVIDGEVYRSAQLSPEQLGALSERFGLRSIVNLRGDQQERSWYPAERQAAAARDLDFHSLRLSGRRLPSPDNLASLLELLSSAERPTLVHCLRGTDRSGLASALARLLAGDDLATARREFSIHHGYLAAVSPSDLREVLDLYEAWLEEHGLDHSPEQLHRFAREGYTPYFYSARIEALDLPLRLGPEASHRFTFRVTNTSSRPWMVTPNEEQGVHLAVSIHAIDRDDLALRWYRGDTPEREVAPGEALEVPVRLPAFPAPGRYRVHVDMVDEWVAMFAEMGSQPLDLEIEVLPTRPGR
jgi:protein tyrosine phosphatase (PTP) superfamily phosphohydrolase (DUF442 family)